MAELWDNDVSYHPNLGSLRLTALAGCPLCTLFYTRVEKEWTSKIVEDLLNGRTPEGYTGEVWYPNLWLHGDNGQGWPEYGAWTMDGGYSVWLSCGKFNDSGIVSDWAHEGVNKSSATYTLQFNVYATEGSLAASRFRGRFSNVDHDPELHISMIRSCLENCRSTHKLCSAEASDEMPTRVIDVGNPDQGQTPRLLLTDALREPYLALSYCWGPGRDTFTLTQITKDEMLNGINESQLVKTHQEVLRLTRSVGIRYVWIDALCIIQGDAADWAYESQRMAQVYGNAALTVIAGRSDDARLGFMIPHVAQEATEMSLIPLEKGSSDGVYLETPRSKDVGPLETRGWCLQEKMLSPRAIVFGQQQLCFRCRTHQIYEDGELSNNERLPFLTLGLSFPGEDRAARRQRLITTWYRVIYDFTQRSFSNPHDIFAGISSLAKLIQDRLESRYLAGIWEKDMVRGLLWKPGYHIQANFKNPVTRPKPTIFAPAPVIRAPSWSWASIEGPLAFQTINQVAWARFEQAGYAQIRPKVEGQWTMDTNCDSSALYMRYCELRFFGRLVAAEVREQPSLDYLKARKYQRASKLHSYGRLLTAIDQASGIINEKDEGVLGVGFFDIPEELCGHVSCFLVVPTEGLMVIQEGEGWKRVGWFVLGADKGSWFRDKHDVEIILV